MELLSQALEFILLLFIDALQSLGHRKEHLIAHLSHKCLLSTSSVPGTGLTSRNTAVSKTDNILYPDEEDRQ